MLRCKERHLQVTTLAGQSSMLAARCMPDKQGFQPCYDAGLLTGQSLLRSSSCEHSLSWIAVQLLLFLPLEIWHAAWSAPQCCS